MRQTKIKETLSLQSETFLKAWLSVATILHKLGENGELLKVTKSVGAGLCLEQCDFVKVGSSMIYIQSKTSIFENGRAFLSTRSF